MRQNDQNPVNRSRNLERLLWTVLFLVAALLRLTDLASAPLNTAEAFQALAAYQVAHGGVASGIYQAAPLLFHLNVLLFALFGGGDGLARLVPALSGVGLVLTPLLLRRYLGGWGALGTGLLLALSPIALYGSRLLDGTMPAALGVMLLVGCAARFLDSWHRSYVVWGGLGLAVALTAGPAAWGLLLGLLIALAGGLWVWRGQVPWVWPMVRPSLGRGLAAAGLGVLALGTGLGLNPGGLAAVGQQFLGWLARFGPPAGPAILSPFLLLVVYEPLTLVAGLVGLAVAVGRRHGMGLLWVFWTAVGVAQLALMPARQPSDLMWVLLPLAGLGGLAVETLVRSLQAHGRWQNEGLYLPVSLLLWIHLGLTLARYARTGSPTDQLMAGLVFLFQLLLTVIFGLAMTVPEPEEEPAQTMRRGLAVALRAGGLSLGLVLLGLAFSIGWRLSHRGMANPLELPVRETTAVEVRTLAGVIERLGELNPRLEEGLSVTFIGEPDPALRWALRRFEGQVVDQLGPEERPPLVLAPLREPLPSGYLGENFPLRRAWVPGEEEGLPVRWWLYREVTTPPTVTAQVVLWAREDLEVRNTQYEQ